MNKLLITILIILIIILLYKRKSGFSSKEGFQCDPATGKKIQIKSIDTSKPYEGQPRYGGIQCITDPNHPDVHRVSPGENKEPGGDYCPVDCTLSDTDWDITTECNPNTNKLKEGQKILTSAQYGGICNRQLRDSTIDCRTAEFCNSIPYIESENMEDCDPNTGKVWESVDSEAVSAEDLSLCNLPSRRPSSIVCDSCIYNDWEDAECDSVSGKRVQRRNVKFVGAYGPGSCAGPETSVRKRLTNTMCGTPVDCVTSDWSSWSACNKDTGLQTRTRTVITPAQYGGSCPALSETQTCRVDCEYGAPWTLTNICNSTTGKKYETNTILYQPKNGGTSCVTDMTSSTRRRDATTACDPINCVTGDYALVNTCTTDDFLNEEKIVLTKALYGGLCDVGTRKSTFKCNLVIANGPLLPAIKGVKSITINKPTGDGVFHLQRVILWAATSTSAAEVPSSQISVSYNKPLSLGGGAFASSNVSDANAQSYTAVDPAQGVTTLTLTLTNPIDLVFIDVINLYNSNTQRNSLTASHTWSRLNGTIVNMFSSTNTPLKTFTLANHYNQRIGLINSSIITPYASWALPTVKTIVLLKTQVPTLTNAENSFYISEASSIRNRTGTAVALTGLTAYYVGSMSLTTSITTPTSVTTPTGHPTPSNIIDNSSTTVAFTDPSKGIIGMAITLTTAQILSSITIVNTSDTTLQTRLNGVIAYLINPMGRVIDSYVLTGASSQTINIGSTLTYSFVVDNGLSIVVNDSLIMTGAIGSFSIETGDVVEFVVTNSGTSRSAYGLIGNFTYKNITYNTTTVTFPLTNRPVGSDEVLSHPWVTSTVIQTYPNAKFLGNADAPPGDYRFRWVAP